MENTKIQPDSVEHENDNELAHLNDLLRRHGIGGRVVVTPVVQQLSSSNRGRLMTAIALFSEFDEDNDPYGERDYGVIEFEGRRYAWKIQYYDLSYEGLSLDPLDQTITRRLLIVMRADEY